MNRIRVILTAVSLGIVALPAAAGGISFDLPRLEFPAPGTETSRDCVAPLLPGSPAACAECAN